MVGMGRPTDQDRREAVKILAERHGITRVDEVYEDGETLLSRAAGGESCLDLLRLLIVAGADVNHAGNDGATPLYRACTAFNTEGARLLVEAGSDVNAATREGETPLMNAAQTNHIRHYAMNRLCNHRASGAANLEPCRWRLKVSPLPGGWGITTLVRLGRESARRPPKGRAACGAVRAISQPRMWLPAGRTAVRRR